MFTNLFLGGFLNEDVLVPSNGPSALRFYIGHVENTIKHLERASIQEKRIRAIITLMDMYEMIGKTEMSCQLANDNLTYVRTMFGPAVIAMYENHCCGKTLLAQKRKGESAKDKDGSKFLASCSDQELSETIEEMSIALSLPRKCVHKGIIAQQKLAFERVENCEHLQLLLSPPEPTLGPVKYSVVCDLHGYGNTIIVESYDYEKVFADFKDTHCKKCSDRHRLELN